MEKEVKPVEMPMVQIGKQGVTDQVMAEIKAQLRKKKILKVKTLKSARIEKDRKEIAQEVALKAGASLADVRGNTFILERKRGKGKEKKK